MKVVWDHWKYFNFTYSLEKLEYVVPQKWDTERTPFFCLLTIYFKDGLQNNHWVGNSVIKPVDVVLFKKIKALRKCNNWEIYSFAIEILDEGALDKALEGPKKRRKNPGRKFMKSLITNISKNCMFSFQNSFY